MNWLKIAAVVVGGIIVFFVANTVIHLILGLLTALVFVALVGGGIYAAAKVAGARKRRALRQASGYSERRQAPYRPGRARGAQASGTPSADPRTTAPWPAPNTPPSGNPAAPGTVAPRPDVEGDLARLKREMGN